MGVRKLGQEHVIWSGNGGVATDAQVAAAAAAVVGMRGAAGRLAWEAPTHPERCLLRRSFEGWRRKKGGVISMREFMSLSCG